METPRENKTETINCLRCVRAQLLPETDMSDSCPLIFCAKTNEKRPLILSGCGIADPKPQFVPTPSGRSVSRRGGGDRSGKATEVEKAWLAANFARSSWKRLSALTGRLQDTLAVMARRFDWPGRQKSLSNSPAKRRAGVGEMKKARERAGVIFSEAQSQYLRARYGAACRGEDFEGIEFARLWPQIGGGAASVAHNAPIRADIIAQVNRRGAPRSWKAIRDHLAYHSPSRVRQTHVEKPVETA